MVESDVRVSLVASVSGMAVVGVCALAACSSPAPGTPTGVSTTPVSSGPGRTTPSPGASGDGLPAEGAPKVQNPLDVSVYREDPCRALTSSQSQELNIGSFGKSEPGARGNSCTWSNLDTGADVNVQFSNQKDNGLSRLYGANKAGLFKYFQEYPDLEGYPAVAADQVDSRSTGSCIVTVGVSDDSAFQVGTQQSRSKVGAVDACDVTIRVVKMMLQTMKAGT
jgi:uncharacterized protein DUF3558